MKILFLLVALFLSQCNKNEGAGSAPDSTTNKPVTTASDKPTKGELIRAVVQNDNARVSTLLQMGADINENIGTDTNQITPILTAVASDHESMAIALFMRGADATITYEGYDSVDFANHRGLDSFLNVLNKGEGK